MIATSRVQTDERGPFVEHNGKRWRIDPSMADVYPARKRVRVEPIAHRPGEAIVADHVGSTVAFLENAP
jgi:hypothetical protein